MFGIRRMAELQVYHPCHLYHWCRRNRLLNHPRSQFPLMYSSLYPSMLTTTSPTRCSKLVHPSWKSSLVQSLLFHPRR